MAPEMLDPPLHDYQERPGEAGKCDVYSYATLVWEMLTRQLPWVRTAEGGRSD